MPVHIRVDASRKLVEFLCYGTLTDDDVRNVARSIRETPGIQPEFDHLVDTLAVDEILLTTAGVQEYSQYDLLGDYVRRAVVVKSDHLYGIARMFEQLREDRQGETRVFRSLVEALDWLEFGSRRESQETLR